MAPRILLLGENPRELQLIWSAAHTSGLALDITTSVDDALSLLRMTLYALVIMDLDDRWQQALDEGHRIRSALGQCTVPLMAVSARATREEVQRGLRAGYDYYLTKPLDLQQLETLMRNLTRTA
jgi:DNA-binding response OmpR family regulator